MPRLERLAATLDDREHELDDLVVVDAPRVLDLRRMNINGFEHDDLLSISTDDDVCVVGGHDDLPGFLEVREDLGERFSDHPLVEVVFRLVDDERGRLGERDKWQHRATALTRGQLIDRLRAEDDPHLVVDQLLLQLEDLKQPVSLDDLHVGGRIDADGCEMIHELLRLVLGERAL